MFDDGQDVVAGALDAAGRDPVLRVVLLKVVKCYLKFIKDKDTSNNLLVGLLKVVKSYFKIGSIKSCRIKILKTIYCTLPISTVLHSKMNIFSVFFISLLDWNGTNLPLR